MHALDHVSITVPSIEAARPFYDAIMAALGIAKVYDRADALGYGLRCNEREDLHSYLAVYESAEVGPDSKRHWCFKAANRAQVTAFHATGLAHGGKGAVKNQLPDFPSSSSAGGIRTLKGSIEELAGRSGAKHYRRARGADGPVGVKVQEHSHACASNQSAGFCEPRGSRQFAERFPTGRG